MVRFLHIADLHLGMRITRFSDTAIDRVREARFEALERVRQEASKTERDYRFVIIAGDLFDDVRVQREISHRAFRLLESFPVPVVIISGNHDPVEPGSVWDADCWNGDSSHRVHLFRERAPVREIPGILESVGVTFFPCPVFHKTSYDDPTAWIVDHPRKLGDGIRVGIAHGSVKDRANLPEDDHPIDPDAPTKLDLDYLALGHWHRPKTYTDASNHPRMIYPGVHEPMRFSSGDVSGWKPYSTGGDRPEFGDDGAGRAFAVTFETADSPPTVEEIAVGRLKWRSREETLERAEQLDDLIRSVAEISQPELTLLRLTLSGTLPLEAMERLEEVRQVLGRFVVGQLDDSDLHAKPTEEEIRDVVGNGVLKTVFDEICAQRDAKEDGRSRVVAEQAVSLLYRYAQQSRGKT